MSSIEEIRSGIAMATQKCSDGLGMLQGARSELEGARNVFAQVSEGSAQSDVSEAMNLLAKSVGDIEMIQGEVQAAIQASESVGARL